MFSKIKDFTAGQTFDVEASLTLAKTIFASTERLAALNLNTARSLFSQSVANVKALQETRDVQAFVALQAAQVQPTIEAAIAYSRSVYAIANETKEEVAKAVQSQFAEVNEKVAGLVDKALKSAPAGSETAVAAIRTAISATKSAYDDMTKVAKQVTEIAESNIAEASKASLKVVSEATKAAKKAA